MREARMTVGRDDKRQSDERHVERTRVVCLTFPSPLSVRSRRVTPSFRHSCHSVPEPEVKGEGGTTSEREGHDETDGSLSLRVPFVTRLERYVTGKVRE